MKFIISKSGDTALDIELTPILILEGFKNECWHLFMENIKKRKIKYNIEITQDLKNKIEQEFQKCLKKLE